ncbi:MAG TPA: Re/Si-specific NAD(P)(+) transhydrogenase subunit alpha [Labilithrix sp.]|jgi:NAD(P) transhydrogenase subunit alpha|nr:Re/Si-specific NAD(P)(+) transhydrogenase subunit alpha [Labilithrix sp.]
MRIAVLREAVSWERRVTIVPDSIKRLGQKKIDVVVERGAGERALAFDADYEAAGAKVFATAKETIAEADCVLRLRVPELDEIALLKEGSTLVAPILPLVNHDLVNALAARKVTTLALDAIPRTTVAQMMDVLSSQATCAGYYAVVMAAAGLPRFFPMLITAAGTIAPATLLVLGAGVAGLSAIGAGRRLGARVEAFDVRKVAKEQVESLGAKFVEVESDEDAQTAGGYAKEVSVEYKKRQSDAIAKHAAKADAIVCTALIPGKRAPVLITEEMVKGMRPGSIIVDLAAEQGGNCALTEAGKTVVKHRVTIIGAVDLPSHVAVHASQMWSRNMEKLLLHVSKDGALVCDANDEIVRGCLITRNGEIVHEAARAAAFAAQPEAKAS